MFKPTQEQKDNLALLKSGKSVKIVAGAGSGKSSSLRYMAASMPHKTFLVWCFNAANAEESNNHPDKPDNIIYSTGHSTAYREIVDAKMRKKLGPFLNYNQLPIGELDLQYIINTIDKDFDKNCMLVRRAVLDCITQFCRSDTFGIDNFSIPYYDYIFNYLAKKEGTLVINGNGRNTLSELTKLYWAYLTDANKDTQITHDVYLKMYHLSGAVVTEVWDKVSKRFVKPDIIALDECLTGKQTVKTDKGLMRIQRLYWMWYNQEPLPNILSYNIEKAIYEYKPMLSALQSTGRETLLVQTEGLNKIECTPNHKILTQRGYVEAGSLEIGKDYVLIDNPENQKAKTILNDDQYQIVLGSFLGDGHLERRSLYNTFRLKFTHGIKQLGYLESKANCFNISNIEAIYSGYTGKKDIYRAQSKTFILDKGIWESLEDMDSRALAIWYMDDGYYSDSKTITISSNSFTYAEHIRIVTILNKNFKLYPKITKDKEYFQLSFTVKDSLKLLELTKDYIHEELRYKNPFKEYTYKWDDSFKPYGGNFVSSIESIGKHTVYDIEVADNHNFITTRSIDNYSNGSGIIVHNCQDTNPVMQAIFERQPHQKLIIGDPMQQLYAWRGAGDAMKSFADFSVGYLTESFRFNSTIADMANLVLRKAGSSMQVKGSSTKTDITSYAHLCRTNASVVARIFAELGSGKKVYTSIKVGDVFSKLYHMQSCWFNEKPKYPSKELASITDKESLIKALEYSEELQRLNKLSQHLTAGGNTLTSAKKQLDSILVKTPGEADIVISTIHASKGMEYDYVVINDDFLVIEEEENVKEALERLWECEPLYCMLYVAITRARVECVVPWYLEEIFNKATNAG